MDSQHLLVPIKVQALVIDDIVTKKTGAIEFEGRLIANDGRWSPQVQNYQPLLNSAKSPGPRPFFGATRKFNNRDADQLVLDPNTNREATPQEKDRGVYLHWVLPSGLRHACTPGMLDFPKLPDHWLIVRFSRNDATLKTRAWFVDGGAVVADTAPTNLVFPGTGKHVGKRVGKVVPLEDFTIANFSGERAPEIIATGTTQTGSPTFTASIAENRNIFSWHDDLNDLRGTDADKSVRDGTTLTYCVLGWYRDPQNEPLASSSAKVKERRDESERLLGWLIEPPGWSIDATGGARPELLKRRSVFHGMVAHINYWSRETYRGQILGYPGAPSVGGTMSPSKPGFRVGVGNNAEDALVSLVSSEYSGEQTPKSLAKEQPNLWKALEAVMYRQAETLVKSWNVAPRDMTVHQNWFETREAGKIWYIRPAADQTGVFPTDPAKTAEQTSLKPTENQLALLKQLNETQADADAVSRELAALQQDLYVRWWKLVSRSKTAFADFEIEKAQCGTLAQQVNTVREKLKGKLSTLQPLPDKLKNELKSSPGLELKYDAAPRFWSPADPVIVVKNCGSPSKHQFPRELPCRLPDQIVTTGQVSVKGADPQTFRTPTGVADIATAAQKLPSCPVILNGLLNEASIVEQAIRYLVDTTAAPKKPFRDVASWSQWTGQLVNDLTWDGDLDSYPSEQVIFGPDTAVIRPHRLADLWVQQPWSPLFIDWQITWFPTAQTSSAEQPFGPVWNFGEADFIPVDRQSIPKEGFTLRGRSLLSPIDDRIFKEPIETLGKLLKARRNDGKQEFPPAVIDVLERYEIVWNKTLIDLPRAGLMGQALTGFHQSLLRRDVTLPRINPDGTRPWLKDLKDLEEQVRQLLEMPTDGIITADRLSPPMPAPTTNPKSLPFSLIRAGALRIDELWLVDDFGQFADLLGTTVARSTSSGQVFHPRMRWHDDPNVFALPPRVLQPARLNFRFTAASETRNESEPALNAICGWIFYNALDQALVLCDRKGELMGHLAIVKEADGIRIKWEAGAGGVALSSIANKTLREFAESLIEKTRDKAKLIQLLNLIDNSLERIRPAAARRESIVVGRPLALVSASVGLELFGKAWTDPHLDPAVDPSQRERTGDQSLNALLVRVNLGHAYSVEDGLIGYFREGAYQRIVVPQLPEKVEASPYIGEQKANALRVGFDKPESLVLLMDPWGSVQAACGIVPAKTITLAHPELNKTVAQMEASFKVGPVLLQADKLALPTPTGNKGIWNFAGPTTEQKAAAVAALDPRYFSEQPVIATEGRLLLLNEE